MGEQIVYPATDTTRIDKHRPSTRRRRPSLWDSREPQYGIHLPAPGTRTAVGGPAGGAAGWAARTPRALAVPGATGSAISPGGVHSVPSTQVQRSVVRAPDPGESGLLAGIDVAGLRALLGGARGAVSSPGASQPAMMARVGDTPHTTRHARRLYVGNLPAETSEAQVADFFNRALILAHGTETPENPVVSVYINLDKRFAFIETRTMNEAAAALQLDGVLFRQMSLRMRRPNDFSAALCAGARAPSGFDPSVLGIVSTQVSDGPNKVFIGGIPYHLTEDQIKDLLQTYGRLAAFNLIKEPNTGLSKGFAFFEYADPAVMDAACEGLNGMQVEDKVLTVRKASTHAGGYGLGAGTGLRVDRTAPMSTAALLIEPTRVLELRNVVTEEELGDDEEYKEIVEEMEEEGRKFGNLLEVLIPKPDPQETDKTKEDSRGVGRVFLKYSAVAECERAFATMSGRKFDQRTVLATYFDEDKFERKDF